MGIIITVILCSCRNFAFSDFGHSQKSVLDVQPLCVQFAECDSTSQTMRIKVRNLDHITHKVSALYASGTLESWPCNQVIIHCRWLLRSLLGRSEWEQRPSVSCKWICNLLFFISAHLLNCNAVCYYCIFVFWLSDRSITYVCLWNSTDPSWNQGPIKASSFWVWKVIRANLSQSPYLLKYEQGLRKALVTDLSYRWRWA